MPVDFYATQPHYIDHMLPIHEALPRDILGTFYTALHNNPKPNQQLLAHNGPVIVAGFSDFVKLRGRIGGRALVLLEHGAGQTYGSKTNCYADGEDRRGCALFLSPGPYATTIHKKHHPRVPVLEVGLVKLAKLLWFRKFYRPEDRICVALTWHWDCYVCPETRATWQTWLRSPQIHALLNDPGLRVIGHGHPREWAKLLPEYQALGIEPVEYFQEVVKQADVLCVDNSSVAFEAVAVGIPTILLNHDRYCATHGLRFGSVGELFPSAKDYPTLLRTLYDVCRKPPQNQAEIANAVYSPNPESLDNVAKVLTSMCI